MPLRLTPAFKDYLWGGRRLAPYVPSPTPEGPLAEAWLVSSRPEGMSRIENGPWTGSPLSEAIRAWGTNLLGTAAPSTDMPLLIKLIDARDRLSVQVHPDDASAARGLGEAKSEMWIVLDAEPESRVHAGFRPGLTRADIDAAFRDNRFEDVLRALPVRPGDAIWIPGGRVHAIDAGCLILEIQQNSNTTYRLYDWGRVDANGKPRQTHWEQALKTIRWDDPEDPRVRPIAAPAAAGSHAERLHDGPYFQAERWSVESEWPLALDGASFRTLLVTAGRARLRWNGGEMTVSPGRAILIPAALDAAVLVPETPGVETYCIRLAPSTASE